MRKTKEFEEALEKLKGKEFTIKEFREVSGFALSTAYYYLIGPRIKSRMCECGKSKFFKVVGRE